MAKTTTESKPTILLVHGAWHNSQCWNPIISILEKAGYECIAPELVSCNWDNPPASHLEDLAVVRAELENLVHAGKEVVVVMHSYGGLTSGAIEGLEKKVGGTGGGVVAAVFIAAFLCPKDSSLMDVTSNTAAPYLALHPDNPKFLIVKDPHEIHYQDMSREQTAPWIAMLRPQAMAVFESKVQSVAWEHVPCTYISTRQDQGVFPVLQDKMIEQAKNTAKHPFNVVNLENSHSVWLSNAPAVSQVIVDVAKG